MKIKGYTDGDLFECVIGKPLDKNRVLATYANPKNWIKGYCQKTGKCQWIWDGPVICAFELAQWGLDEQSEKERHEHQKAKEKTKKLYLQ